MQAPDKIYLERDKETNKIHHLWGRDTVISSLYEHIEYIRKDALLELINKKLQESADRLDYGTNKAYAEILDKLNSM